MTARWTLTIEYKGTGYAGWQRQKDVPSIQQAIEEAIFRFCQQEVTVQGAGRTDAGVHAYGQVAHVDLADFNRPMTGFEVAKAINAHLRPQPVSILEARKAGKDFHARYSATGKLYRYRILNRPAFPALERGLIWHIKRPDLDAKAMQRAAQILTGYHDFTTFRDSQCQAKSPERTLDRLAVTERPYDDCGGREIIIEAEAQSFLHHMVRNIAGSLVLVGEGKWRAADLKKALEARDRTAGGPTAPAGGLALICVNY